MKILKSKFNIGDTVYYIYFEKHYKSIGCDKCGEYHQKISGEWKYNNNPFYISGINVEFCTEQIKYILSIYEKDELGYEEWVEWCDKFEEDIFTTPEDAIKEVEKRNSKCFKIEDLLTKGRKR
jgi:hypothetical protein